MAIRVEIQLADGQFVTRMMHAGESVRQFNENLQRSYPALRQFGAGGQAVYTSLTRVDGASKGFLATMRDISIVAGVVSMGLHKVQQAAGGLLGSIVKVNSEFENMSLLMKSMSSGNDRLSAEQQVKRLREEAAKAPFSLHALQDAATKLKATGFDPLAGSLRAVEDAVAAVGGGDEKLNRVTLAITQMAGKGVIQMEELRQQLGEALPQATELMARSMGLTISELIQKISTGTVAARPALNGLFLELERTFGGQAERMMQTFSGQLTRTTTLLQGLALRFGEMGAPSGSKTFFTAVKQQLNDLNNFLASDFAGRLADSMNNALVTGVNVVRSIVDGMIELRGVIKDVGEVAIWAFGIFLTNKLLGSVTAFVSAGLSGFRAWRAELAAVNAQLATLSTLRAVGNLGGAAQGAMAAGGFAQQIAQINALRAMRTGATSPLAGAGATSALTGAGAAMGSLALSARGAMAVLPLVASTAMTLIGVLPLLGMGIYAVADYFDLFGNKARNAWEELQQFGATSMKQIQDAQGMRDMLSAQLKDAQDLKNAPGFWFKETSDKLIDAKIKELQDKIDEYDSKMPGFQRDAEKAEAERRKSESMKAYQDQIEAARLAYNQKQKDELASYEKTRNAAIAAGKDTEVLQRDHRAKLLEIDMAYYDQQLKIMANAEAITKQAMEGAQGIERKGLEGLLAWVTEQQTNLLRQKEAMQEQGVGLTQLAEPTNLEKALTKGQTRVENLREEIAGLNSQLQGGTREAGELEAVIRSGLYGPAENSRVQKVVNELLEAQKQADALNEVLDAMTDAQGIYNSEMKKLNDEHMDFVTKNMGPEEALRTRFQMIQDNLSPGGKAALVMTTIRNEANLANSTALDLAQTLNEKLFGTDTQGNANTLLGIIQKIAGVVSGITGSVNGMQGGAGMSYNGSQVDLSAVNSAVGLIKKFEGFISSPKWDVNAYRVGYGSDTVTAPNGAVSAVTPGMTVTLADADRDLFRRVGEFQQKVVEQIGSETWGQLDDRTQQALTSVAYNYGSLPKSIADAVKTGNKDAIAAAIVARSGDNGGINAGRRSAEANYMMTGNNAPVVGTIMIKNEQGKLINPDQAVNEILSGYDQRSKDRIATFWQDLTQQQDEAIAKSKEGSSEIEQLKQKIREGFFDDASGGKRNPDDAFFKPMIEATQKLVDLRKKLKDNREAGNEVDSGIEENTKRIEAQTRALKEADEQANKNPYAKRERDIQAVMDRYDALIKKARDANGGPSAQEKQLLAQREAEIALINQKDVQATLNTLHKKEEALRESLGTERQQHKAALDRQLADLDAYVANFKGTKEEEARITAQVEQTKSALIAQYAQQNRSAIDQQMADWADMGKNLEQAMANAMSSVADGITDMLMGEKVNWKNIIKGIVKDLVNTAIHGLMSGMMGGKGGAKGGLGNIGGMGGAKGLKSKMGVGVKHTGGIVGVGGGSVRSISPAAFMGAPRFHTGGIIGGMGIGPDEVPIIARKGEGVFTPEQMDAMGSQGGVQQNNVTTNVSVNATGGDAKQNDDLAKRVAKEVENSVRGIVFKEMRQQMRPGNSLAR